MKKIELIKQLEAAKTLSSTVDIDKVITLIEQIEIGGLTSNIVDKISDKIERELDDSYSRDLVDLDSAEFELNYNNTIELVSVDVNIHEIIGHVNAVLDEFIVEEDEDEEKDSTEEAAQ